ncbi:MAG: M28 family peptidase [Gemmatimonadaceae bacterium]|nr:M28 family peptidase [Gemmatimonadaceae bacterium]NUP56078.1 M28 family peptidase [Gemmatimonadaceae bacterium]NUS34658.1 M28 family peptidase [Gemmatimonadaceae bacterium]
MRPPLRLATVLLVLTGACRTAEPSPAPSAVPDAGRILHDIAWLADDRLEGRGTGTAGNDSAAAWLARRHAALGVRPLGDRAGYVQVFTARSAQMAHAGQAEGVTTRNVLGLIPGRDPALRGEYVVIGAHFDHLGRSAANAMDPEARDAVRNGADDNASGTAAVLELARLLVARPARRPVVVAHFSGEEVGLLGSQWFVDHPPVSLDSAVAMVNFDMVGRLRNDKLIVYGVATARELPAILDSANVAPRLAISAVGDGFGPSDQSSFYARGVPVLHFFTGLHDDYHRASDDVAKINAAGEARVVALAERVVRAIADRPAPVTRVRMAARAPAAGGREGSSVYLGTVPDMSAGDAPGLRLTGVRSGSPADAGGLRAGDVIIALGGRPVKHLYSYSDALYAHQPGDRVDILFVRAGERRAITVTLGRRGP